MRVYVKYIYAPVPGEFSVKQQGSFGPNYPLDQWQRREISKLERVRIDRLVNGLASHALTFWIEEESKRTWLRFHRPGSNAVDGIQLVTSRFSGEFEFWLDVFQDKIEFRKDAGGHETFLMVAATATVVPELEQALEDEMVKYGKVKELLDAALSSGSQAHDPEELNNAVELKKLVTCCMVEISNIIFTQECTALVAYMCRRHPAASQPAGRDELIKEGELQFARLFNADACMKQAVELIASLQGNTNTLSPPDQDTSATTTPGTLHITSTPSPSDKDNATQHPEAVRAPLNAQTQPDSKETQADTKETQADTKGAHPAPGVEVLDGDEGSVKVPEAAPDVEQLHNLSVKDEPEDELEDELVDGDFVVT